MGEKSTYITRTALSVSLAVEETGYSVLLSAGSSNAVCFLRGIFFI